MKTSRSGSQPVNAQDILDLIERLRADEGDSVTILCDNPDFNGQPNCAVVCNGDWTGYEDKRFAADTLLDALSMAWVERQLPSPRKVIAESNGHHWIERFNLVCCRDCGFVRRADDQNKPCQGVVKVGLRSHAGSGVQTEGAWHPGAPAKPWASEWFIAETTFGDRVCLTALPDGWTYDFKTADDTYIKADKIKRWMQFPDSEFIAPASPVPSADRGREAREKEITRLATIEECAQLIESGAGMADLIDQDDLDEQAKMIRALASRVTSTHRGSE